MINLKNNIDCDSNFITKYQLFTTVILTIIGVGNFSYPSSLTKLVGTDGWLVTIIVGFIVYGLIYCIYKVEQINNYKSFIVVLKNNFGDVFGKIVAIILTAFNIYLISIGMRVFAEVLKMYLLPKTPIQFIVLVMILVGILFIRGEFSNMIMFNEISFGIIFIPMLFILIALTKNVDLSRLLPMFQDLPQNYIIAISISAFAFDGIEILYLIIPSVKEKRNIPKVMSGSIIFITVFYIILTIMSIGIFGVNQTKYLMWPTISMIKSINISGSFIEQWEGIVMIFWILFYFTTFANTYFFSCVLLKDTLNLGDVKISSLILAPFVYIFAVYSTNLVEVFKYYAIASIGFSIFSILILIFGLLIVSIIKTRRQC